MLPPPDVLEAGPPLRRTPPATRKRKKSAPLPAYALPTPPDNGKAMQQALTQMRGLSNLRNTRMKTAGGNY